MSVSSGTVKLFSAVAFAMAAASSIAYGLKHKDELNALAKHTQSILAQDADAKLAAANSSEDKSPYEVSINAGPGGHFETEAEVNGRSIDVMVDTGATLVAMTYEDAERAGIFLKDADFTHMVSTANGKAKIAPVQISSVSIGGITVRNVQGAVTEPGKLQKTLLGMSFLGRLSRVDMRSKTLILQE